MRFPKENYNVVGEEVYQNGCFTRTTFWVLGWVELSEYGRTKYIDGLRGRETLLVQERIVPQAIFKQAA